METAWELYFKSKLGRLGRTKGVPGPVGLTQKEIGGMLGVSQQTVSRYYSEIQRELAWSSSEDTNHTSEVASLRKRLRRIVRL